MSIDILAIGLAELQASIAEKESELERLHKLADDFLGKKLDTHLHDKICLIGCKRDELEAALAKKERELAELREKVRRWAVAREKLRAMVQNDYYVDDHTAAKHNLKEAEAALRASVERGNINK